MVNLGIEGNFDCAVLERIQNFFIFYAVIMNDTMVAFDNLVEITIS